MVLPGRNRRPGTDNPLWTCSNPEHTSFGPSPSRCWRSAPPDAPRPAPCRSPSRGLAAPRRGRPEAAGLPGPRPTGERLRDCGHGPRSPRHAVPQRRQRPVGVRLLRVSSGMSSGSTASASHERSASSSARAATSAPGRSSRATCCSSTPRARARRTSAWRSGVMSSCTRRARGVKCASSG